VPMRGHSMHMDDEGEEIDIDAELAKEGLETNDDEDNDDNDNDHGNLRRTRSNLPVNAQPLRATRVLRIMDSFSFPYHDS
jgi:hypothetical protein